MKKLFIVISILFLNTISPARAGKVDIRGFGTAALTRSDQKNYFLDEFQTSGTKLTATPDSRFGLNISSNISEKWKVAAQFIAQADTQNYTNYLEWGFVSYQWMPEVSFRAGKVTSPLWLYSQQISVGYSYLWVRPPVEVYSLLNGLKSINGASVLSSARIGPGVLTSEIFAGGSDMRLQGNNPEQGQKTNLYVRDMIGLDLSYAKDDIWTLHGSYAQGRTEANIESSYPVPGSLITNSYYTIITPLKLGSTKFFSLGGKVDYKNFILTGEFARRLVDGESLRQASAWYGSFGYRVGDFTPYYTYSWQGNLHGAYYLHPSYPTVTTLKRKQYSHLLGLNTQLSDAVVLKGELQRVAYEFDDYTRNIYAKIFNLSVDFIF